MAEEDSLAHHIGSEPPMNAKAFRDLEKVQTNPSHFFVCHTYNSMQIASPSMSPSPAGDPDSFSLLVDAVVMLGRINDFNIRARMRYQAAIMIPNPGPAHKATMTQILDRDPKTRWDFQQLNANLNGGVGYWSTNSVTGLSIQKGTMPRKFKNVIGVEDTIGGDDVKKPSENKEIPLDKDLFLSHMVHYA